MLSITPNPQSRLGELNLCEGMRHNMPHDTLPVAKYARPLNRDACLASRVKYVGKLMLTRIMMTTRGRWMCGGFVIHTMWSIIKTPQRRGKHE
jgi:hypothetical protein